MPANFCKNCIHWEANILTRAGENFGICDHVVVGTKVIADTERRIVDNGTIYTEEFFGCVYFECKPNLLVSLPSYSTVLPFKSFNKGKGEI